MSARGPTSGSFNGKAIVAGGRDLHAGHVGDDRFALSDRAARGPRAWRLFQAVRSILRYTLNL